MQINACSDDRPHCILVELLCKVTSGMSDGRLFFYLTDVGSYDPKI